jgi:hypothetical protein
MHGSGPASAGRTRGGYAPSAPPKGRVGTRVTTPVQTETPSTRNNCDSEIASSLRSMLSQMDDRYKELFEWTISSNDTFLMNFVSQTITYESRRANSNAGGDVRFFQWAVLSEIARASRAVEPERRDVFGIEVENLPTFLVAANMQGIKTLYGSESPQILKAFAANSGLALQQEIDSLVKQVRSMGSAGDTTYRVLMSYSWPECDGIADVDWNATIYRYSPHPSKMVDGIRTIGNRHPTVHEGRSIINVHGGEAPEKAIKLFRTHFHVCVLDGKAASILGESDDEGVSRIVALVNSSERLMEECTPFSRRVDLATKALIQMGHEAKRARLSISDLTQVVAEQDAELLAEHAQMKLLRLELDDSHKKEKHLAALNKTIEAKRRPADERARVSEQALKDSRALMYAQIEEKRTQLAAAQDKIAALDNEGAALAMANSELTLGARLLHDANNELQKRLGETLLSLEHLQDRTYRAECAAQSVDVLKEQLNDSQRYVKTMEDDLSAAAKNAAQDDRACSEFLVRIQELEDKVQTGVNANAIGATRKWSALAGSLGTFTRIHKKHSDLFSKLFPRAGVELLDVEDLLGKLCSFASGVLGNETCALWPVKTHIHEQQKKMLEEKQAKQTMTNLAKESTPSAVQCNASRTNAAPLDDEVCYAVGLAQQALERVRQLANAKTAAARVADERAAEYQRSAEEMRIFLKGERAVFREVNVVSPIGKTPNTSPDGSSC